MQSILDSWTNNEIYVLSPEEVAVFKDAVKDVTAQFAAEYGPEACAAFDITVA